MNPMPTETLTAAAIRAREIGDPLHTAIADLFDIYATRYGRWTGPHISAELAAALDMAHAVMGTPT
ncbi:hypothetical protein OG705_29005 [Streptomyces sp. NBC_00838]|uniref:hypothetical protein n=1 Tax=Streptomyces sp. NBC_00838 TaxID=2903680 RepID=UPI00386DCA0B|nr:hypothetical protein OG705_29005 [Streptomyces sp. NBC_00838]